MKIAIIKAEDLAEKKFETCVQDSDNFFMQAWVLNILCDQWAAIVLDDYEAVLPFPVKKKYFIPYIYQAAFIPRFSFCGRFNEQDVLNAGSVLKKQFPLIHLDTDKLLWSPDWIKLNRKSYLLNLSTNYQETYSASYSSECKRNIEKANKRGCNIEPCRDWKSIVDLYHEIYGKREGNHLNSSYSKALLFLKEADSRNCCKGYRIYSDDRELLYAGITIIGTKRLYYWLGAPTARGREYRATYFFIDHIVKANAGSGKVFDFEGSDFPNVAKFYSQFTSEYEEYVEIKTSWL